MSFYILTTDAWPGHLTAPQCVVLKFKPNLAIELSAFLPRIREASDLNLDPPTGFLC
jgi:hypothetical protein